MLNAILLRVCPRVLVGHRPQSRLTSEKQPGHVWSKLPLGNSLARSVAYGTTTTGVEMSSSQVASGAGNSTAPTLNPRKLWIIASMEGIV